MGKTKSEVTTSELAENALDSKSEPVVSDSVSIDDIRNSMISTGRVPVTLSVPTRIFKNGKFVLCDKPANVTTSIDFLMSETEQIHALSLSQQIMRGQGEAKDIDDKDKSLYYDFPDGRDDGRDGVGLYDLSEPAQVFESEHDFKKVLNSELRQSALQQQADKAQKETVKKAQEKASHDKLVSDVADSLKDASTAQ